MDNIYNFWNWKFFTKKCLYQLFPSISRFEKEKLSYFQTYFIHPFRKRKWIFLKSSHNVQFLASFFLIPNNFLFLKRKIFTHPDIILFSKENTFSFKTNFDFLFETGYVNQTEPKIFNKHDLMKWSIRSSHPTIYIYIYIYCVIVSN